MLKFQTVAEKTAKN